MQRRFMRRLRFIAPAARLLRVLLLAAILLTTVLMVAGCTAEPQASGTPSGACGSAH